MLPEYCKIKPKVVDFLGHYYFYASIPTNLSRERQIALEDESSKTARFFGPFRWLMQGSSLLQRRVDVAEVVVQANLERVKGKLAVVVISYGRLSSNQPQAVACPGAGSVVGHLAEIHKQVFSFDAPGRAPHIFDTAADRLAIEGAVVPRFADGNWRRSYSPYRDKPNRL